MLNPPRTRLTAAEYAQLPETMQPRNLIDGEVIVSPAPKNTHQEAVENIFFLLKTNAAHGLAKLSPADVYLDEFNIVQPDVFWINSANPRCTLGEDDYWHGSPDLCVEVLSPSTARLDRVQKFQLYERFGVSEYWICEPYLTSIELWLLTDGQFLLQGTYTESFTSPILGNLEIKLQQIFKR